MVILWIICGLMLVKGVRSLQWVTAILVPLTFLLLIVLVAMYMGLNNGVEGKGVNFYLGGEEFAGAKDDTTFSNLFIDAYNQVFFSVGV